MDKLIESKCLFLDGGLGTTLEDLYGIKYSAETPLWSSHLLISDAATLLKVQREFHQAGSDIILTPTYQASHAGFRQTISGITNARIAEYLQSAVSISRNASESKLVALSLGAYGAILQPSQEFSGEYGDVSENDLLNFHLERISAFDLNDVDIVAFETLPRLDEIRAVKQIVDGSKPYWISCVFPNDDRLPDGSTIEQVLTTMMTEPRPWAIGMNCIKIQKVTGLINSFEHAAKKFDITLPRLVLYPDGTNGQTYDTTKQMWVGVENNDGLWHEKLREIFRDVQSRGEWEGLIIGGCCKSTPQHIESLHKLVLGQA